MTYNNTSSGENKDIISLAEDRNSKEYFIRKADNIYSSLLKSNYYINFINSSIRWNFYNNNQWIIKEDTDTFLLDETNDARNRVKFTMNVIEPFVKFLVGNTIRTSFDYTAVNVSPKAWARREERLNSARHITKLGQMFPEFSKDLERNFNVGKNQEETTDKFNRFYSDEYRDALNILIDNVSEQEKFEELKNKFGLSMAVDGISIGKHYIKNGRMKFKRMFLKNYIWDASAIEPDHSDASYQGDWWLEQNSEILESFGHNLSPDDRKMFTEEVTFDINNLPDANSTTDFLRFIPFSGKRALFELHWEESRECEYAVFEDEFGYEVFSELTGEGIYTEDNIILEPKINFHKNIMKGKPKVKRYPSVGKYVIMTPREGFAGNNENTKETSSVIVLDYGDSPYTESSVVRTSSHSPYSVYCLDYSDGIVHSPVDSVISPQRFINRLISMGESASNNWRPSGTIIDEDAVNGGKDELIDIQKKINKGKTVTVRANGQLNNVIGQYQSNNGDVSNVMLNTANVLAEMIGKNKGINESMTGTIGGYRVSSTAVMSNIQQGSLMQEPFFFALSQVFYQIYNKIATIGKKCYIDNETELTKQVGDNYCKTIVLAKELENEDIRIYIKRSSSREQQIKDGNMLLFTLLQGKLIDDETFASLFNVSSVENITKALYEFQAKVSEAREKAQEQSNKNAQGAVEAQQLAEDAAYADKDIDRTMTQGDKAAKNEADIMKTLLQKEKQQAL
jgi:hypothetical protein